MPSTPRLPAPNLADDPHLALLTPPSVHAPVEQRLRFALHAAVLAPSLHNSQPWRFRVRDGVNPRIDLLMDSARNVPVLDPGQRQLVISCGAALAALELGLRGCGLAPRVELFPQGVASTQLARIHVHNTECSDGAARAAWHDLLERRSYRGRMTDERLTAADREALTAGAGPGNRLVIVPPAAWRTVEQLILQASLDEAAESEIAAETRDWTRVGERAHDGVPASNWQRTSQETAFAPVVQRDFAQGRAVPGAAASHLEAAPELAVLLSAADTPPDWLEAGRSILRIALAAHSRGLAIGFVNQPTEVPRIRTQLANVLAPHEIPFTVPQLVLRIGHPADPMPPATPRRTVHEILEPASKVGS
jgi:nitroreductase